MTRRITLGFSPCPNDTFMFHDLVHGETPELDESFAFELLDIEALNVRALQPVPAFDITKLSLPALARCVDHYSILSSGAALGRGCGPLVVRSAARSELRSLADLAGQRVAIPGDNTTAFLLLAVFGPGDLQTTSMRFDEVMPAVSAGRVDAGLIIHESRFTYTDHGLDEIADLGALWEGDTGMPLPLGIIAARRSLPHDLVGGIESALRHSIENARVDPARSWSWVQEHAQEMNESVCRRHIELYVNDYSLDLGDEGRAAIDELLRRGHAVGELPAVGSPWRGEGD